MASLLQFINGVRTILGRPALTAIVAAGTDASDESSCVLATALGLRVGGTENEAFAGRWVMRFDEPEDAVRVGVGMDLPWGLSPPEVVLPEVIGDIAVSAHFEMLDVDDGLLAGWWTPDGTGSEWWQWFSIEDDLLVSGLVSLPAARAHAG